MSPLRPPPHLPAELWGHVFSYLPSADKLNVRATCKFFGAVVDHDSHWRNWTVELWPGCGSYDRHFWRSLRRRRVRSVLMRSSKAKDWKQLARSLQSSVSTLVLDPGSQANLHHVGDFPRLNRLAVRDADGPFDAHALSKPLKLTHMSLCRAVFPPTAALADAVSALSRFCNLTSLVCHYAKMRADTLVMLHAFLGCLPRLQHLSLSVTRWHAPRPSAPSPYSAGRVHETLSSLELIDCDDLLLSEDTVKVVPRLKSLALCYRPPEGSRTWPPPRLRAWLSDLPHLTELLVTKGPRVRTYISACPPTVTALTLCVPGLCTRDLEAAAVRLPDLRRLHVDPWPSPPVGLAARIPLLFPKLRRLTLPLEGEAESDILALLALRELEQLQLVDSLPHLSPTIHKLRVITDFRLEVKTAPPRTDVMFCPRDTRGNSH